MTRETLQRAKEIEEQINNLKKHLEDINTPKWDRICQHIRYTDGDKLYSSSLLYDDGMVYFNGFVFAKHCGDIFEATQDQIELLNSKS